MLHAQSWLSSSLQHQSQPEQTILKCWPWACWSTRLARYRSASCHSKPSNWSARHGWASGWVVEWLSGWVSEWVSKRVGGLHMQYDSDCKQMSRNKCISACICSKAGQYSGLLAYSDWHDHKASGKCLCMGALSWTQLKPIKPTAGTDCDGCNQFQLKSSQCNTMHSAHQHVDPHNTFCTSAYGSIQSMQAQAKIPGSCLPKTLVAFPRCCLGSETAESTAISTANQNKPAWLRLKSCHCDQQHDNDCLCMHALSILNVKEGLHQFWEVGHTGASKCGCCADEMLQGCGHHSYMQQEMDAADWAATTAIVQ